jgi:hypothetical protein
MSRAENPIIDLHCHIEGSIAPDKSFDILHRADHPLAQDRPAFMEQVIGYRWGWEGFKAAIHLLDRCMMDRATVIEGVSDVVARAAEQNIVILEPTFQQLSDGRPCPRPGASPAAALESGRKGDDQLGRSGSAEL